ncbi:TPA: tetratricopeptide repeat protein [Vibrio vulnificus]|nr:tetratricopeptide repeat protein [Vibrio vulnificus]
MFLEEMLKYQRDVVTVSVFRKLTANIYKAIKFKLLDEKDKLEWQQILIADGLRIVGFCKQAYWLASKVQTLTSSEKHRFWSNHVSGIALQYAGDMEGAERIFLQNQDYGCELSLSFSLQHLGKLHVELGNHELAEKQFTEALIIRKKLKRIDLVDSTNRAMQGLQKLRT